jgi:hypothetical protein
MNQTITEIQRDQQLERLQQSQAEKQPIAIDYPSPAPPWQDPRVGIVTSVTMIDEWYAKVKLTSFPKAFVANLSIPSIHPA